MSEVGESVVVEVVVVVNVDDKLAVVVKVRVGDEEGVGVACATLAALNERDKRIKIPKSINLLTD
jgi:hypothetical protein